MSSIVWNKVPAMLSLELLIHRSFFMDVLSSFITSAKFKHHEFGEFIAPLMIEDTEVAASNPAVQAIDAAHALAFRSGLGSSLFTSADHPFSEADIKSFASDAFTKDNIAVVGTGINQSTLNKLVEESFASTKDSSAVSAPASKYFGGETRLKAHGGPQSVFIGFGSTRADSTDLAAFAAHLSPSPSVKWSKGLSPLASLPEGTSVQTVYMPYSDATLFGLLLQGSNPASVKEAGKVAVSALKAAAQGIKEEELKSAISKAKFAAADAADSREGIISVLGSRVRLFPLFIFCTNHSMSIPSFSLAPKPPLTAL